MASPQLLSLPSAFLDMDIHSSSAADLLESHPDHLPELDASPMTVCVLTSDPEHSVHPPTAVYDIQMNTAGAASTEDSQPLPRFKCVACFKQFKQKEFLIEHIDRAGHSQHEPCCALCKKHCRCLDALREHLLGTLAKKECAQEFAKRGCLLCLNFFEDSEALTHHRASCQLPALSQCKQVQTTSFFVNKKKRVQAANNFQRENWGRAARSAVALDCEMVGGGQDGSFDLCARVCVVDEHENVLLHTYVMPQLPVTDYRFKFTGIKPVDLIDAMPVKMARDAVEAILYNGTKSWTNKQNAKLLVGHALNHDLSCLGIDYPAHLIRDTAYYAPLLRTSNVSHKLQYLTKTYLGYQIQEGDAHDPYEDAVAAMRLYRRMRMAVHPCSKASGLKQINFLATKKRKDLEGLSPEALLELSVPRYQCWCLDS